MDAPLIPPRVEDAYFIAARTSFATSSMSSALSAGNGRFMSSSSSTVLPPTVTTKAPLRGFSLLTSTVTPGSALASRFARVLNAPQLLQASTSTTAPEEPALGFLALAADGFLAGAFDFVFLAIAQSLGAPALPQSCESAELAARKDTSKRQRGTVAKPKHGLDRRATDSSANALVRWASLAQARPKPDQL